MAKSKKNGMHGGKDRKQRGRTSITKTGGPSPTHPMNEEVAMTQVNRGVTANGNMNKHRGDRRDMSKTYTTTQKHSAHASSTRKDVSTRAR